jgi:hypothetical protein
MPESKILQIYKIVITRMGKIIKAELYENVNTKIPKIKEFTKGYIIDNVFDETGQYRLTMTEPFVRSIIIYTSILELKRFKFHRMNINTYVHCQPITEVNHRFSAVERTENEKTYFDYYKVFKFECPVPRQINLL